MVSENCNQFKTSSYSKTPSRSRFILPLDQLCLACWSASILANLIPNLSTSSLNLQLHHFSQCFLFYSSPFYQLQKFTNYGKSRPAGGRGVENLNFPRITVFANGRSGGEYHRFHSSSLRRALDATPRATSASGGGMKAEGDGPALLLLLLLLLLVHVLCCCCSPAAPVQHRIQMMVAMPYELGPPWQNPFLLSRSVAEPVIQLAIDDVSRKGFLNNIAIDLHFRNTNCSDTLGPYYAVEAYCAKQLDVVLGFASAYALAPVARLSGFWSQGVPVITTIAQVDSLDDRSVYKLLTRMNGSYRELGSTIIHLLQLLNYETVAFLFHSNLRRPAFGKSECFFQMVAINNQLLKASGWRQPPVIDFDEFFDDNYEDLLKRASMSANVILMCASVDTIENLMHAAARLGMTESGKYIFFSIHIHSDMQDDFSWQLSNVSQAEREQDLKTFASLKIVTLRRPPQSLYRRFEEDVKALAQKKFNYTQITGKPYKVTKFTSAFYDAIMLYAIALNETLSLGFSPRNGLEVTRRMWNRSFAGIGGNVTISKDGDRFSDYSVLDLNPQTGTFEEVAYYAGSQDKLYVVGQWYWAGGSPPPDRPICGFDNSKCPSKNLSPWAVILIVFSTLTVIFGVIALFVFSRAENDELENFLGRTFWPEEAEQMSQTKRQSGFSLVSLCTVEGLELEKEKNAFTKIANYRGQIVAVKMLNIQRNRIELSRKLLIELKKMKDLSHEHVTRFVGACIDSPHYCIVTEYCPKGSLQGMVFIHSTDIRSHGKLKSTNCVVDSRFVLKITDFGLNHIHELETVKEDFLSNSFWRAKLWTAPELLRLDCPPMGGTQKGDVYSFAVILHEMLFRRGVFYTSDENSFARDIVENVRMGMQPPFRPTVLETSFDGVIINLMVRCWSENPDDRPDFRMIRKQVISLTREFETSNIVDNLLRRMEQYANNLESLVQERTADYLQEKQKAENLLYQLLPKSVASQLIKGEPVKAEAFDCVTIYFSDIVGFTSLCADSTPMEVVNLLNDLYTCFDSIIENYDVYKVETIGDAYMVVSGLPRKNGVAHAFEIARMALALLSAVRCFTIVHRPKEQLKLRIGIHSGPVCAGVVGLKMPRYCLFGDTVNTASRMESNGLPLKIHVSSATKTLLDSFNCFQLEYRGEVVMKGKGAQVTYWLLEPTENHVT
ncbi:Atrial natriuretic peptide receptor 1 [Trichinella pseudospiralis]|uniref:Guanylate cyclase n=1 Tax=Trichinella pseudospiralis TaxID=6337 RepID=A0A0V1EA29_TRIPS|nr:Atrial natriuretic peptide receptor 1 [Trichinella pseudospiralis]